MIVPNSDCSVCQGTSRLGFFSLKSLNMQQSIMDLMGFEKLWFSLVIGECTEDVIDTACSVDISSNHVLHSASVGEVWQWKGKAECHGFGLSCQSEWLCCIRLPASYFVHFVWIVCVGVHASSLFFPSFAQGPPICSLCQHSSYTVQFLFWLVVTFWEKQRILHLHLNNWRVFNKCVCQHLPQGSHDNSRSKTNFLLEIYVELLLIKFQL